MPTPSPAYLPLSVRQGETLSSVVLALTNPDGTPCDLTGCSAHLSVRASPSDTSPMVDLTDANGGLVLHAAAGTITAFVAAAVTAAWIAGVYAYDLFVTFSDGLTRVCSVFGPFDVIATNTRNP